MNYPDVWSEGIINPVYKSGIKSDPDNYRKITLLCALSKIFESVLNNRLKFYSSCLQQDDPFQSGFQDNCRTTDNLFVINALVQKQRSLSKPLFVCFVDFKKAFDFINRYFLFYKLTQHGVNGKFLNILQSMYKKSTSRVRSGASLSEAIDSEFGVLQGGVISPTLFKYFLYDLKEYMIKECGIVISDILISYILFADDLVLVSDSASGLQKLINSLYKYCSKWHLIVNLAKTKVVIFNGKSNVQNHNFVFNDTSIETTNMYKYLGNILSSDSKNIFKENYKYLSDQSLKAIFAAKSLIKKSVGRLTPKLALKVFDTQILPILEYGLEIWYTGKEIQDIEKVHLRYLKYMLGVKTQTSTLAIYGETGRLPLLIRQQIRVVKFWVRILKLPENHMVKSAYNCLFELDMVGHNNWCSLVRHLLDFVDMSNVWEQQFIVNNTTFIGKVTEKLSSLYIAYWKNQIGDSERNPILRTYKLFKTQFCLESYLLNIQNHCIRKTLAKFRLSSHILQIEVGRHSKPKTPVAERTCKCNESAIEDEMHLLLFCSFYSDLRCRFFQNISITGIIDRSNMSDLDFFVAIMSCKDKNIVNILGKYITQCFKVRQNEI